jgi:hypothetical protein
MVSPVCARLESKGTLKEGRALQFLLRYISYEILQWGMMMTLCHYDRILNVLINKNSIVWLLTRWFDRNMKVAPLVPTYFSKCVIL